MNWDEQYRTWFGCVTTNNDEPWRQDLKKIQGKVRREADAAILRNRLTPRRILRHGIATIVFWQDGTKTVVKRHADEPDNEYAAFTAALAIKVFGSNSQIKSVLRHETETVEPKGKKKSREIRVGDRVKYLGGLDYDKGDHKFYPPVGTVGIVKEISEINGFEADVQWPMGTTSGNGMWWCGMSALEVVK